MSYRRYTGIPLLIKVFAFFLVIALIIGGITFIVYSETSQYHVSLNDEKTVSARKTSSAQSNWQKTANVLNTAQANIDASATAQANAVADTTATVSALTDLYTRSTSGDPVFNDALADNTGPGHWDQGNPDPNTGCSFEKGYYFVREAGQGKFQPCIAQATQFSSFAYQVRLTMTKGNQGEAGLIFRVDNSNASYYFFHIGTNGSYTLELYDKSGQASSLLQGVSSAIVGLGRSNQVAVIARSDTIYLYANGHYLATVTDNALSSGKIGLGVVDKSAPVEVRFDNARVWKLS